MNYLTEKDNSKTIASSQGVLSPNITIDKRLIERHDHYYKYICRRSHLAFIAALLSAAVAIKMYFDTHWGWGIIFTLLAIAMVSVYYILRKPRVGKVYESGILVPAVLMNLEPLEIAVMADTTSKDNLFRHYGCKRIMLSSLPLHTLEVGERVPCVIVYGGLQNGHYTTFESRPLSWATQHKEQIEKEVARIDKKDWMRLEMLLESGSLFDFEVGKMGCYDDSGDLMGIV